MSDLVKTYNPATADTLTPEQISALQLLTSDQIKELKNAYPNAVMQRAFLLIIDNTFPVEKQLPQLSTFENLWNLRERNGLRKYVAYGFKGAYKPKTIPTRALKQEVIDLSDEELLTLPGFKSVIPMPTENGENDIQVPVRKIKRQVKKD